MKTKGIAISALALAMVVVTGAAVAQFEGAPQQNYWQATTLVQYQNGYRDRDDDDDFGGRDAREYQKFQQRGYREGYEGARKDFENHRNPTPFNRDEYRHPDDVPRFAIRAYRIAFRQGYLASERQLEVQPYAEYE